MICTHIASQNNNSIWVDITVEEDDAGLGGMVGSASEWEVVTAPTEEEEQETQQGQQEEEEAEAEAAVPPTPPAAPLVVEEQEEAQEDEAWGRWKAELACLAEMGFEKRLDACVEALERLRPTDAEVSSVFLVFGVWWMAGFFLVDGPRTGVLFVVVWVIMLVWTVVDGGILSYLLTSYTGDFLSIIQGLQAVVDELLRLGVADEEEQGEQQGAAAAEASV